MLQINVDHHTDANELDLIGNFLKELAKMRTPKDPETTKPPKKTKAQPVTLTSLEPEAALPESLPTPEAITPAQAEVTPKKPEPVQEPEPEVVSVPEVTEPAAPVLDLVGLRAALAPIMKDKKDALVELVKTYGDSLPKIDPAMYPEILAKAKEL